MEKLCFTWTVLFKESLKIVFSNTGHEIRDYKIKLVIFVFIFDEIN